ncbi:hypothetical protein Tco_0208747, partial [Tanacetum coccineum]
MPYDSPLPRVHTLRSDEGRMQYNKLMDLVTKWSDRVVALETNLHQTKKVYGTTFTKHIKKVQRRHEHDMESNFKFTAAEEVYTAKKEVSTAEPVSTAGASVSTTGASSVKDK